MNAKSALERRQVEQSIDANANAWAEMIRSGAEPGYRAQRDAYCLSKHRHP